MLWIFTRDNFLFHIEVLSALIGVFALEHSPEEGMWLSVNTVISCFAAETVEDLWWMFISWGTLKDRKKDQGFAEKQAINKK